MLNEFYKYIAKNTLRFFQDRGKDLQEGERYCLKLDTEEMVKGVDEALKNLASQYNIQDSYTYSAAYTTYTLIVSESIQVIVAAKVDGMTDDFLATLRNIDMVGKNFVILMITYSPNDSIISGTSDFGAEGMPFHARSIENKIKEDIPKAGLSLGDRTLLEVELERKKEDKYNDKSSLFEYSDLLTVLGRGYVVEEDYSRFCLLIDLKISTLEKVEQIKNRLEDNHTIFEKINRAFKYGNITEALKGEFDDELIKKIESIKNRGGEWFEDLTYDKVKSSQEKVKKKLDNPMEIEDEDISVYYDSISEYFFEKDRLFFVRCDGESKKKQRSKNILIFNKEHKDKVTISITSNIKILSSSVQFWGGTCEVSGKKVIFTIEPQGCSFASVKIEDKNNKIIFSFKICVLDIMPEYLDDIKTSYLIRLKANNKKGEIQILGKQNRFFINPHHDVEKVKVEAEGQILVSTYDKTMEVHVDEEAINIDTNLLNCSLKIGKIEIPLQIKNEGVKPSELSPELAFKLKHTRQKSLEYRPDNKIVDGTKEYFAKEPFKSLLNIEQTILDTQWLAIEKDKGDVKEYKLTVRDIIKVKYRRLIEEFVKLRTVPSLAYYKKNSDLYKAAITFVEEIEKSFDGVKEGHPLSTEDNDMLLIGCIIDDSEERIIEMTPLHPLNILYQLRLLKETKVGEVRENLVEKLSALYLLPFIKDKDNKLYHATEKNSSSEWMCYEQVVHGRYLGTRQFIKKLVLDKINQYKEHFPFLFDDINNRLMCINLISMGDCREVFQGLIRYYVQNIAGSADHDVMLSFNVNIYDKKRYGNAFSLLSNMDKLKQIIQDSCSKKELEDINELVSVVASKVKCFYKNPEEPVYEYAHLTFYEMPSSEDVVSSRMGTIPTGVSLGGIISRVSSVLNAEWYKTGFGTMYAKTENEQLIRMAQCYNAMFRVAFTGSAYEPDSSMFTEVEQAQEGLLEKIYQSSNWVVFVNPKVDLSFFQKKNFTGGELIIIHYSDQYTSASGYDDITVTQKSNQYNEIISEYLQKKRVIVQKDNVNDIIRFFNAINGSWMLRLITTNENTACKNKYFSREKMSILSAVKLCMTYYYHPDITWIPISLEEMLRVSGGAGLSQKDGILSAKNLGFEKGATCDDILLVGIEGPKDNIKIYLHPIEVKIGLNNPDVIDKAKRQVKNTYKGFITALWPEKERDILERKVSRNFFMKLILTCCEKLKLYNIYPKGRWDSILDEYRESLLNENYMITDALDSIIGIGTVISFCSEVQNITGNIDSDGICLIELPEQLGFSYMVSSIDEIEKEIDDIEDVLPKRLEKGRCLADPFVLNSTSTDVEADKLIEIKENEGHEIDQDLDVELERDCNNISFSVENYNNSADIHKSQVNLRKTTEGIQVLFGTDITNDEKLFWCPNDTEQIFHTNTGIIGTMGTGKTQFTKSMITQLYRNRKDNYGSDDIGILIFDYKGDYNESKQDFISATNAIVLKPYELPFNPLSLIKSKVYKPLLPIHTANAFKDTLSKVYSLGPKQQNALFQCIVDAYMRQGISIDDSKTWDKIPPTFNMVYKLYSANEEIKKNDSLAAAMDKLYQFKVFEGDPNKTQSLFDIIKGVVVIDLSGYDEDIQSLIVAITLDLFYSQMQATGSSKLDNKYRQITKMILVDEADNFMSKGFPALKKILKEGREFGVGTILSTQFLKHFGTSEDDYSKYILTWVVHNVSDLKTADVEFVFRTEGKNMDSQKLYNDIKNLNKHYSIVKIGNSKPKYIHDKAFWELHESLYKNE